MVRTREAVSCRGPAGRHANRRSLVRHTPRGGWPFLAGTPSVKVLVIGALVALALVVGAAAHAAVPAVWKNCTAVNKRYPHGIGRVSARDRTSGEPVRTFRRSNRLYRVAMSHNRGLDRDKDGIACEQE